MRKFLFSGLVAAALLVAATPNQARASWLSQALNGYFNPGYYSSHSYYSPGYIPPAPAYYYTPGYSYVPWYRSYAVPYYGYARTGHPWYNSWYGRPWYGHGYQGGYGGWHNAWHGHHR